MRTKQSIHQFFARAIWPSYLTDLVSLRLVVTIEACNYLMSSQRVISMTRTNLESFILSQMLQPLSLPRCPHTTEPPVLFAVNKRQHLLLDASCFAGRRSRPGWSTGLTITHNGAESVFRSGKGLSLCLPVRLHERLAD